MAVALPPVERTNLLVQLRTVETPLIPARPLKPGEQYRFHFDMTKCIGCKCCVVACNEQNGNPAAINWRRVGELEGGIYPHAERWHLSMACNHCLEPSCLKGCPVEAYTKDTLTGIVDHNADVCIGCQYCTWNCSYGVPQFNVDRGVVGKCDMCHPRLDRGLAPACVNACPEEAIAIEIVNVAQWREHHHRADAPGLPSSADSLSTTRITLPLRSIAELHRVDAERVQPQHPHWSLVFMLVLTQMAVGALGAMWAAGFTGASAVLPVLVAMAALGAVTLHLGRPIHFYRALKGWRTSWLSREVLVLSIFAGFAQAYAASLFFAQGPSGLLGFLTVVTGVGGVFCSAKIYMVPARPAWNMPHTVADFYLTGLVLGPLLALTFDASHQALYAVAAAAIFFQFINQTLRLRLLATSSVREMTSVWTLLRGPLQYHLAARYFSLALALAVLGFSPLAGLLFALAAELLGRYLFFTAVVPKSVASTFLTPKEPA